MAEPIYLVIQEAVYFHSIYGPFSLSQAKRKAKKLAQEDKDNHHHWAVYLFGKKGIDDTTQQPVISYVQEPPEKWHISYARDDAIKVPRHEP